MRLLRRAIEEHLDFAFETTLGANTIPRLLGKPHRKALRFTSGTLAYRVRSFTSNACRARVRRGGHDIAAEHIHRRYEHSRLNLIELLPRLTALRVFDNSEDTDPAAGKTPKPKLVLHLERGKILNPRSLKHTPDWAKPIVAAALKLRLS